jgi:predicted metal-dependent phosphoesterase TrpH
MTDRRSIRESGQLLVSGRMKELAELLALPAGARFRSVELHVHTPASHDIDPRWRTATAEDVVRLALARGLEVIAVTDHNSVAWCDVVRAAARDGALQVLPGVEISTSEGHLLAIFDREKPTREIEEILVQVGIRANHFGDLDAIASMNLTQLADLVDAEGGVAIAAHVDGGKGFWKQMQRSAARRREIYASAAVRAFRPESISINSTRSA